MTPNNPATPPWSTYFGSVPRNVPLLVLLENGETGEKRYSVLLYWAFGDEHAWMTTDSMEQIDPKRWIPIRWMHIPTQKETT